MAVLHKSTRRRSPQEREVYLAIRRADAGLHDLEIRLVDFGERLEQTRRLCVSSGLLEPDWRPGVSFAGATPAPRETSPARDRRLRLRRSRTAVALSARGWPQKPLPARWTAR